METQNEKIYLSPPHLGELEKKYVENAFQDNWISSVGPNLEAFEAEINKYTGMKGALALATGTAAIHLALKLCGVKAGDTVLCSSFTFAASANPIVYEKAKPVFIDSEPNSWNMCPKALERACESLKARGVTPKAVIIVSLYGQSADMDPLLEICDRYQIPVIEDAAESLGATYKNRKSGTFGRFGIYSFNGNKIITSSGGGALVSNDIDAIAKARFWSTQSRDAALHYQHSELGFNYRMSNILAGVGLGQLKILGDRVSARRKVFERYQDSLMNVPGVSFMPESPKGFSTRWLTVIRLDSKKVKISPAELVTLLASQKIEARPAWKPMHLQPFFSEFEYFTNETVGDFSAKLFAEGVCLPSGSSLTPTQQDRVITSIRKALS